MITLTLNAGKREEHPLQNTPVLIDTQISCLSTPKAPGINGNYTFTGPDRRSKATSQTVIEGSVATLTCYLKESMKKDINTTCPSILKELVMLEW